MFSMSLWKEVQLLQSYGNFGNYGNFLEIDFKNLWKSPLDFTLFDKYF